MGQQYDAEAHFVHQNPNDKKLLVLAVLFKSTDDPDVYNNSVGSYWLNSVEYGYNMKPNTEHRFNPKYASSHNLVTYELLTVAFANEMYNFAGSLTTPPCTEGVKWLVSKHIMHMSDMQKVNFQAMFPKVNGSGNVKTGNNRPVQPLGNRTVHNVCLKTNFEYVTSNKQQNLNLFSRTKKSTFGENRDFNTTDLLISFGIGVGLGAIGLYFKRKSEYAKFEENY